MVAHYSTDVAIGLIRKYLSRIGKDATFKEVKTPVSVYDQPAILRDTNAPDHIRKAIYILSESGIKVSLR